LKNTRTGFILSSYPMAGLDIRDEHVKKSIGLTRDIIARCGPRLAGSRACKDAAGIIYRELGRHCDTAQYQHFQFHPRAFFGHLELIPVLYVLSTLLLLLGFYYIAWAGFLFLIFVFTIQFVYYKRFLDPLYTKAEGINVIGTIEPAGRVKQQIIVSGHHDSARIFRLLAFNAHLYVITLSGAVVTGVLVALFLGFVVIFGLLGGKVNAFADALRIIVPFGGIFFIPLFFFLSSEVTEGAGDNLIASSMLVTLAQLFAGLKRGRQRLNHTRLRFISFDAEESGLRGSRAYARTYKKELQKIPTYNLNLDSIFDVGQIKFLTWDINGTVRLSEKMAGECVELARELGYTASTFRLVLGMGGTDAAEMARVGVHATSLIALRTDFFQKKVTYHTLEDTAKNLDPKAVRAVLKIVHAYILKKEREADQKKRPPLTFKNIIRTLYWWASRKISRRP
jgi:aminopeptidase YwaD